MENPELADNNIQLHEMVFLYDLIICCNGQQLVGLMREKECKTVYMLMGNHLTTHHRRHRKIVELKSV